MPLAVAAAGLLLKLLQPKIVFLHRKAHDVIC
jgi:hypothetical protein